MSRLIVKNLPKVVNEQKLRNLFGQKGTITDIQLKYKDGKFRQFAFVGYEKEESAEEAVKFFNDTFIGTSKVKVERCATLGDESKPQSWSKYAKDSVAYKKKEEKLKTSSNEEPEPIADKKKSTSEKIDEMFGDYKDDPEFQEFMKANAKDKLAWENDFGIKEDKSQENMLENDDDDSSTNLANQDISDAEYLKQLKGESTGSSLEKKINKNQIKLFTVKIRNIPKKIKREELKKFFRPSKAHSIRIPKSQVYACAYVGFKLERDMKRALTKDKSFLKGKQVHVYEFNESKNDESNKKWINPRWQEQEEKLMNEESICDSGKLFFRNLPYTVTEDDVQKVFEKFGNIVEINVPIDSATRKLKGFGTVTFLMPEHAVQAYTELNGTMFNGRMFHILPAKTTTDSKPTPEAPEDEANSKNYKDQKLKDMKKSAASAHNWNTLFMGSNVVADAISKTYGRSKEEVLGASTGGSDAAVRLALGETQIVLGMKKFLEAHGVQLEAFEGDPKKRSKTVILIKNLPINTHVDEMRTKFEAFGVLEKIVLPPNGITCLVKFADPSEARKAFKKLAYSRFKHVPLYLEWAPENVFRKDSNDEKVEIKEAQEQQQEEIDDSAPENNTTLFIKNINFSTSEDTLKNIFSSMGTVHSVQIAKKKGGDGKFLPLGYGFIQFKLSLSADKALKNLQHKEIDGYNIELKRSDRTIDAPASAVRKGVKNVDQKGSTKIMVRNIPFQAKAGEIRKIFETFGELRALRLPLKKVMTGPEQHRGFGFVDFANKSDAKNAFDALHFSTHLYGRRLILEWASTAEDLGEIRKRAAEDTLEHKTEKKSRKGFIHDDDFAKISSKVKDDEEEDE